MMATTEEGTRATFTYIWVIENIIELTLIDVKCPKVVVKTINDVVLYLHINEFFGISCYIREGNFSEKMSDGIDIEISFLGADGSALVSKTSSEPVFYLNLMRRDDFKKRKAEFIQNNTLTVQFRMWKRDREIPADVCYARTRLQTRTESFLWAIEKFSSLRSTSAEDFRDVKPDERKMHHFKPVTEKEPFLALMMYLKQNSESEDVWVQFLLEKGRDYNFCYELSLLDANGKVIVSRKGGGRFMYGWTTFPNTPLFSKNKLISNKNLFLPNDTLVLRGSFVFCTGVISNEIEYFTPNVLSVVEEEEESPTTHVAEAAANEPLELEEFFVK